MPGALWAKTPTPLGTPCWGLTPFLPAAAVSSHRALCVCCSVVSDSLRPPGLYPAGSSVHGILQARILEWVAIPFSGGSSQLRYQAQVSRIAVRFLYCRSQMWNASGSDPRSQGILTPFRLRPGRICVTDLLTAQGKWETCRSWRTASKQKGSCRT